MNEQSYIVRIYRSTCRRGSARRNHDNVALDGIVEFPANGEHRVFHDVEELWRILAGNAVPEGSHKSSARPRRKR
ncbi:MAG: hypothetical protein KKH12_03270 [Gammaproteobacteria bacterium]|nr:hypothetical protein [Gammaproteobacteria bacterium]MBU1480676.1 hypothetical protein [Gammaproteobacteria bacterium]